MEYKDLPEPLTTSDVSNYIEDNLPSNYEYNLRGFVLPDGRKRIQVSIYRDSGVVYLAPETSLHWGIKSVASYLDTLKNG